MGTIIEVICKTDKNEGEWDLRHVLFCLYRNIRKNWRNNLFLPGKLNLLKVYDVKKRNQSE